jgi:hypothetical protein
MGVVEPWSIPEHVNGIFGVSAIVPQGRNKKSGRARVLLCSFRDVMKIEPPATCRFPALRLAGLRDGGSEWAFRVQPSFTRFKSGQRPAVLLHLALAEEGAVAQALDGAARSASGRMIAADSAPSSRLQRLSSRFHMTSIRRRSRLSAPQKSNAPRRCSERASGSIPLYPYMKIKVIALCTHPASIETDGSTPRA